MACVKCQKQVLISEADHNVTIAAFWALAGFGELDHIGFYVSRMSKALMAVWITEWVMAKICLKHM